MVFVNLKSQSWVNSYNKDYYLSKRMSLEIEKEEKAVFL